MGWKGTMRSMNAAMRAAERESQRRHKQHLKELEIADAQDAVGRWKDHIHDLISIHANPTDDLDWQEIGSAPAPTIPAMSNRNEARAQDALATFKPGLLDVFQGGSTRKREKLEQAVTEARALDEQQAASAQTQYEEALREWERDVELSARLLAGEQAAKMEVIQEFQSLSSEYRIGEAIEFKMSGDLIHAIPTVHTDEIIPDYRRKQLASGRLSETKMPVGEFNELYQDYVCSVALRVAGDLFGLLPDSELCVTCRTLMLNSITGHQEQTPILSVHFVRETYGRLNLQAIDPSDSLQNFNHVMNFKRTKGFAAIEPLMPLAN